MIIGIRSEAEREIDANILHDKLFPLQKRALWFLAIKLGHTEMQCIVEDFLRAVGEIEIDGAVVKDIVDFWYVR